MVSFVYSSLQLYVKYYITSSLKCIIVLTDIVSVVNFNKYIKNFKIRHNIQFYFIDFYIWLKRKIMRYKNLSILFKNNPNGEDEFDGGTHKVDFLDAVLMISGEYLVITEHSEDGNSITGQVYPLNTVHSYKATR